MTNRFYINHAETPSTVERISFAYRDSKGREIGCVIERSVVTFTAEPLREYASFYADKWLGAGFGACVEAARDGKRYGASQRTTFFQTEAEREAFVAKRIEASRKAAGRK